MISSLNFSQNGYPKELIKGDLVQDTGLVALTWNQLKEVNKGLEQGEGCKVLLSETEKLVLQQDGVITTGKQLVANLEAQLKGYNQLVKWQDQKFDLKEKQYNKLAKSSKTTKTVGGIILGVFASAVLTLGIYIAAK